MSWLKRSVLLEESIVFAIDFNIYKSYSDNKENFFPPCSRCVTVVI